MGYEVRGARFELAIVLALLVLSSVSSAGTINVLYPENNSVFPSGNVDFGWNATSSTNSTFPCSLYINNALISSKTCANSSICEITSSLSSGNQSYSQFSWYANCTDTSAFLSNSSILIAVPNSYPGTFSSARLYATSNFRQFFSFIPIGIALSVGITLMGAGIMMGMVVGAMIGLVAAYGLEAMSINVQMGLGLIAIIGLMVGIWGSLKTK